MKSKVTTLLILIVLLWGCSPGGEESFPLELIGIWNTNEPRYDGCSIEIQNNQIIFSNIHEDHIEFNRIEKIKKSQKNGKTMYNIDFVNKEGLEFNISLVYMKTSKYEVIFYKNQTDVLWIKEDEPTEF